MGAIHHRPVSMFEAGGSEFGELSYRNEANQQAQDDDKEKVFSANDGNDDSNTPADGDVGENPASADDGEESLSLSRMKDLINKSPKLDNEKSSKYFSPDVEAPIDGGVRAEQRDTKGEGNQAEDNQSGGVEFVSSPDSFISGVHKHGQRDRQGG